MIKLFVLLVITCIAIFVGPMLSDNQGFVHVVVGSSIIETSFNTAVILYVVSLLVLFLLYVVLRKLFSMPSRFTKVIRNHSKNKKSNAQMEAFLDFTRGEYDKALGLLKHSGSIKNLPTNALIIAAQSSCELGMYNYTRDAMDELQKRGDTEKSVSDVVRANLNYKIGNIKVALDYLNSLNGSLKNKFVYSLYLKCYEAQGDYESIVNMSNELLKFKVLSEAEIKEFYVKSMEKKILSIETVEDIKSIEKEVVKASKSKYKITGAIVYKLIKLGETGKAREITLNLLKNEPDPVFIESISHWDIAIPDVLITLKKYAEKNAITAQVNLPLLKAMGNLEFYSGLLPEALSDYKKALSIEPSPEIYLKIGAILTNQNKLDEASDYFTKANSMIADSMAISLN